MDYGLFAQPMHPPHRGKSEGYQRDVETFILADQLGYHEAWMGEHYTLPWENVPAPDLFVAHVIPQTERIILGTGVVVLPFHDPRDVAMRIAYLDHLAQGRFYFGIGPGGGFGGDFELMDVAASDGSHRARTRDAIDAILTIWQSEPPFEYQGEYFHFSMPADRPEIPFAHHMRPFQKPHPPIMVAGSSRRSESFVLCGERGWLPTSLHFCAVRLLKTHWEALVDGAQRAGRVPDRRQWRIARAVWVAETDAMAYEQAVNGAIGKAYREYEHGLLKSVGALGIFKHDRSVPDQEVTADYLAEHIWIVGSPDTVTEKIRKLYDDVGGFGSLIQIAHDPDDWDTWRNCMTLFAKEVMPNLKDLVPAAGE